jgi:apolipoprotein N-acyltransferase
VLWINIFIYKAIKIFKVDFKAGLIYFSAALSIFVLIVVYGFTKISSNDFDKEKIKVGIIQPNIDPWNKWALGGLDDIREIEAREERWKSWGRDKLFLGADSDHPDGIYARGGADMICMTNDEYRHWFNG